MHAQIQSSIGAALANATMQILLRQQEYNSTSLSASIEASYQFSDAAMPYSASGVGGSVGHSQEFRALLTRHPQYSKAVNIFFLVMVLTWAFWERIMGVVGAVDDWLVEETMREEHRVWKEEYWGRRRGWKPVGILKRRAWEGERKWAQIGNARKRRVTFAQDVKDFDGENEDGCWDLCEGVILQAPLNCAVRV